MVGWRPKIAASHQVPARTTTPTRRLPAAAVPARIARRYERRPTSRADVDPRGASHSRPVLVLIRVTVLRVDWMRAASQPSNGNGSTRSVDVRHDWRPPDGLGRTTAPARTSGLLPPPRSDDAIAPLRRPTGAARSVGRSALLRRCRLSRPALPTAGAHDRGDRPRRSTGRRARHARRATSHAASRRPGARRRQTSTTIVSLAKRRGFVFPSSRDLRRHQRRVGLRPARRRAEEQRQARLVARDGPGARRHRRPRRGHPHASPGVGHVRPRRLVQRPARRVRRPATAASASTSCRAPRT